MLYIYIILIHYLYYNHTDPALGGYPTPVDTKYVYEFAAPFLKQPGDGSVHHCAYDASDVGACPKFQNDCGKDCASITEEFGIGHVPPFVPLAAVKNAYNACEEDICTEWFDEESECSIKKSKLDELVIKQFVSICDETCVYNLICFIPSDTLSNSFLIGY